MPPTHRKILQEKQQNVPSTAQPPHLTKKKKNLTKPETASSVENVWRTAFAQGNGNSNPNSKIQKEIPKSLAPQKALPLWSSQTTKLDKENKSIAIQDSIGVGTDKKALKRRLSTYMRPEELAEVVSRVKKAIETPPEKVRKSETVPQTKKSVKKTTDAAQWKEKKKEKTKQDQKEQTVKRAGKTKTVPQPVKVKNSKDEKRLTTEAAEAVEDKGEFLRFLNLAKNKEKTKQDQKEQTGKRARKPKTVPQPVKFKNSKDERRLTTGTADAVEGQGEFLRFVNLAKNKEKTKQDQKEQTVKRARKTATVPQAGKVKETKDERRKTTDAADAVEDKGEFLRFLNLTNTQQLAASTNRRSKRRTRYKNDDRF